VRVPPYTTRILLGSGAGLIWLWIAGPRRGFSRRDLTGLIWVVALGALAGGRLGYGLEHLPYFTQNPAHLPNVFEVGGLDGVGAWLGGLCGAALWIRVSPPSYRPTLEILIPTALLVAAGAWWACAHRGCAWGREVRPAPQRFGWLISEGPDLYHTLAPRFAVQQLSALLAAGSALLSMLVQRCALLLAALYAAATGALSHLRADPEPLVGGLRLDSLLLYGLALSFVMLHVRARGSPERHAAAVKGH
jgi:prolipoprotein diacylglyceryltransferase